METNVVQNLFSICFLLYHLSMDTELLSGTNDGHLWSGNGIQLQMLIRLDTSANGLGMGHQLNRIPVLCVLEFTYDL